MGSYSGLHATKLDSHANMAVAGSDCTVIATSGCHATVTPFSSNLPMMNMVEIDDVAIAYNDTISLQTCLLVMRNALLIPMMDHNLIPPFLIQLAGLQVDETPKHQLALPTIDNHAIYDSESRMHIYLKLNGIFQLELLPLMRWKIRRTSLLFFYLWMGMLGTLAHCTMQRMRSRYLTPMA
jgi:hypothetical protein